MRAIFVLVGAALVAAAPMASAETPSQAAAKAKVKGDPNRIVCKDLDTTGSRLNRQRDCRTAQQWAEMQALNRQTIDQQQANRWKNN